MGRKSSAKAQSRTPVGATPPASEPPRGFNPLLIVAFVAVIAAVGLFAYSRSGQQADAGAGQTASSTTTPPTATPVVADVPEAAKRGPHKQENLPPLPFNPSPPARPADVVRAAYQFAAEHPEVLSYVPCYCGCERSGHRGNEDCFVTARASNGDVTEWEPHGMT